MCSKMFKSRNKTSKGVWEGVKIKNQGVAPL